MAGILKEGVEQFWFYVAITHFYLVLCFNVVYCARDGRFVVGDELVNVNGSSLRGVTMEEARHTLRSCSGDVDIIVAREGGQEAGAGASTPSSSAAPVERRKRRKLPMIERPKSAPIYPGMVDFR